jgi:hypothetical protein
VHRRHRIQLHWLTAVQYTSECQEEGEILVRLTIVGSSETGDEHRKCQPSFFIYTFCQCILNNLVIYTGTYPAYGLHEFERT